MLAAPALATNLLLEFFPCGVARDVNRNGETGSDDN
jgi:hypothetical protein